MKDVVSAVQWRISIPASDLLWLAAFLLSRIVWCIKTVSALNTPRAHTSSARAKTQKTTTGPRHSKDLKKGTKQKILKNAGLSE